ncbi:gamma-glutamylcyclotransferase [Haliea sp. E1-2-M8]|uniref:gamma-glutamylcyclotransferase n=1 Tax=Haliea sp. E1-2-M8 TaxID=3064706 RepID=UPI002728D48A|nr:gamma-glutamylcyclotransferase [Haliea sp. E1-2-M8]MDO8861622.1 gamma-glutamylcyclotransferase [Haliea sp. E1-2-M8]
MHSHAGISSHREFPDAYYTANPEHAIYGVVFEIDLQQKSALDKAEALGYGYDEKKVVVVAGKGSFAKAMTYVARDIDVDLSPYSWYVNHVIVGAYEASLPADYIHEKIFAVAAVEDRDRERDAKQRAIHS